MIAYRIADARHPIFDPQGAMLHGGRWNSPGRRVIYAAETFAGAMLELLVHANLATPPKNHRVVRISIPQSVKVESLLPPDLPGWDDEDCLKSRKFGDAWLDGKRSAVLRVPGVVTAGRDFNVLLNPSHANFKLIEVSEAEEVRWDSRLFGPRT